ncbi:MAG: esterase YqiA [Alteromonadaceae bacterium]|nr:esterase YqiA [Alteromonadaceae bacterium]
MKKVLIYLHGFLSSPQSVKAEATKHYWQQNHTEIEFVCLQLPYYPKEAQVLLNKLAQQYKGCQIGFIGSSLGGFLATYMVDNFGGRAVLINPAAKPHEVLSDYLGEHTHPYTNERFTLQENHMTELADMHQEKPLSPQNIWALLQTEDETLDYRDAAKKYADAKLTIEEGGDHAFQGYERFLPQIFEFLFPK